MSESGPAKKSGGGTARRSFLIRFWAVVCSIFVGLFPVAAGLGVIFDPCRRRKASAKGEGNAETSGPKFVPICSLDEIPSNGVPVAFPVISYVVDAWTHANNQRVGLVFLSRTGGSKPVAFNAACPHLGCFVDFNLANDDFECPCHKSAFARNGKYIFGPSRRGLDPLEVKLDTKGDQTDVLVAFQNFEAGIAERKPIE